MSKKNQELAPPPPPLDAPVRRRLPHLLRQAWYGLNQAFRRRLAPLGLTPDQFTILRILTDAELHEHEKGGLTQREIAERMTSDPNTVSALLKRMEAAGYIERVEKSTDRRALRIGLKPAVQKNYQVARRLALELQSQLLESVPLDFREGFLECLELVAKEAARQAGHGEPGDALPRGTTIFPSGGTMVMKAPKVDPEK